MSRFLVLVLVPGSAGCAGFSGSPVSIHTYTRPFRFVPLRIFQIVASCWAADCWLGAVLWVVDQGGVAFTCVLNRPFAIFAYTHHIHPSIHHTTHWLYGSHTDTHLYKFNWLWTHVCVCVRWVTLYFAGVSGLWFLRFSVRLSLNTRQPSTGHKTFNKVCVWGSVNVVDNRLRKIIVAYT